MTIEKMPADIKHWGLSGYASFLPRIKFVVTVQKSSLQSPTISNRRLDCAAYNKTSKNG
jgi:hypothetical protein